MSSRQDYRSNFTVATLAICMVTASVAQDSSPAYDFPKGTRELTFDPTRLLPNGLNRHCRFRYLKDDYGFPVYAIAVGGGCIDSDWGCFERAARD